MKLYRHGDLIIREVSKNKSNGVSAKKVDLALGEHTGHHHELSVPNGAKLMYWGTDGEVNAFSISDPATLTHQEHRALTILPGNYEIVIEREKDYFSNETRKVLD